MTQYKEPLFLKQINMLQSSSKETVVHANSFDAFPNYMHTERPIEKKIIEAIEELEHQPKKQLILLAGSVGDGKSHLLSFLKSKYPNYFHQINVHNDATESHNPEESSINTLEKVLQEFNDNQIPEKHTIVAINIGVLHNFYHKQQEKQQFNALRAFIEESGVFDINSKKTVEHEQFQLYNFASDMIFHLGEQGAYSPFLEEILRKIIANHPENPIYQAWKQDMEAGYTTMAHFNYQLLQNSSVQKHVLEKLYHIMLLDKVLLSTRAFYHFIFTIVVPSIQEMDNTKTGFDLEHALPNLLFNHPERSNLLEHIHKIDPLNIRNQATDDSITKLHIITDKWNYISQQLQERENNNYLAEIYQPFIKNKIAQNDILSLSKFIVRAKDLIESTIYPNYHEFIRYLHSYYKGSANDLSQLFRILRSAFLKWKGSPKKDYYFVTNDVTRAYRMALHLKLKENVGADFAQSKDATEVKQFKNFLTVGYGNMLFELDFHLFELLKKVQGGYRPNTAELNSAIQFEDFYKQLIGKSEEESEELLIVRTLDQKQYIVSRPGFSFNGKKFKVEKIK
ncbi:DNA phosphorothioation-dependent restriction protein DptF [Psychrobacillus insolitus]|uniref:DNA phosphorothioation-dependent restriction protein DptF n=1 Tax=Psychrobacillus insolitus TaxID=1461 RepID=A0A2W7ML22_9BACI|nr:DNA phosphorothioation-dependent restriction protein DptF [Psychrobacillus insolitus]PZX04587.1 DNA phosphorothioation-dependent restriction protein DptF [Psychrobacillus insolitus]